MISLYVDMDAAGETSVVKADFTAVNEYFAAQYEKSPIDALYAVLAFNSYVNDYVEIHGISSSGWEGDALANRIIRENYSQPEVKEILWMCNYIFTVASPQGVLGCRK